MYHHEALTKKVRIATVLNGNGEEAIQSNMTMRDAICILRDLKRELTERERARGMLFHSFQSVMAWATPDNKLSGDCETKLTRMEKRLAGERLTSEQQEKVERARKRIRAAQ